MEKLRILFTFYIIIVIFVNGGKTAKICVTTLTFVPDDCLCLFFMNVYYKHYKSIMYKPHIYSLATQRIVKPRDRMNMVMVIVG